MLLIVASLAGCIAVIFGAYADHGLRETLDPEVYRGVTTAIRYNQIHAVAAMAIGLALFSPTTLPRQGLAACGWIMLLGVALFSGSIYGAAVFDDRSLIFLAPIGGSLLILSWLGLASVGVIALLRGRRRSGG